MKTNADAIREDLKATEDSFMAAFDSSLTMLSGAQAQNGMYRQAFIALANATYVVSKEMLPTGPAYRLLQLTNRLCHEMTKSEPDAWMIEHLWDRILETDRNATRSDANET